MKGEYQIVEMMIAIGILVGIFLVSYRTFKPPEDISSYPLRVKILNYLYQLDKLLKLNNTEEIRTNLLKFFPAYQINVSYEPCNYTEETIVVDYLTSGDLSYAPKKIYVCIKKG